MKYLPAVVLVCLLGFWLMAKAVLFLVFAIFWAGVIGVGLVFLWILGKLLG